MIIYFSLDKVLPLCIRQFIYKKTRDIKIQCKKKNDLG